jgi:hypothetical protein
MLRNTVLSLVVCLAAANFSLAQEYPKPGPEHEKIKELEGTWDAVMDMGGQKSKATAVYKSICNGMWMESNFEGDIGGSKFQGHGLDGYNLQKKKYVGIWVDSMSSAPLHFEGEYDTKSKLLVMIGESVGPDGKPHKFKNTTETKDKDHFIFKMHMVDSEGKETLVFSIDYMRHK